MDRLQEQLLQQKNDWLETQLTEKTAELQQKNREIEIEAALEKVRSRSLAMHKSEEAHEVVNILFASLIELNVEIDNVNIIILKQNTTALEFWVASPVQNYNSLFHLSHTDKTVILHDFQLARDTGKNLSRSYPFEVKNEYFKYLLEVTELRAMPEDRKKILFESSAVSISVSFEQNTALQANRWSEKSFTDKENEILKRFSTVFEQAYIRFLDLQKAEAQAREAIKASSLDRVRGEIASMRNADDLQRITPLVWKELTALGVPFFRCGVMIVEEKEEMVQFYLTTPDGKPLAALHMNFNDIGITKNGIDHWRKQKVYTDHWDKEQFTAFTKSLIEQGQIQTPGTYQGGEQPPETLTLQFVPFKQGMMYVGSAEPLDAAQIGLVKSLAETFSVAYSRYEDFIKLEAARQQLEKTLIDLKQAHQQLVQSEKMASFGELTAGIAHEIQNPLNFVTNFSEVSNEMIDEMKEELATGNLELATEIADDIKQNLEKIIYHGKRADAIVKGMLQHSRTSAGQKEPTNVNALCDEFLRLSYHGLRAKDKTFNANFKTDFDETIGKINIIPQDIGRVLLNLFNNAFYAVNENLTTHRSPLTDDYKPLVSVQTKKIKDEVEIIVSDNGNGIPENILDKIFQPFFTTKPTGEGTGLGLSLSYDIIKKVHGGEIKVETKEGEGSEFIIVLPV